MVNLTPRVALMERAEWDNSGQPRLGYAVSRSARTELIVHHTVAIDPDASPLVWETEAEIIAHMRVLRTIRPDLGLDIPYNWVAFMRPNLTLTICEGRGLDRTGAHTHAHNTSGVATCMAGDFHNYPLGGFLSPFVLALNDWFWWQKGECANLAVINGHRDYAQTSCPGQNLYALKPQWSWVQQQPPAPPEDDMFEKADRERAERIEGMLTVMRNIGGMEWRFVRESSGPWYLLAGGVSANHIKITRHAIPNGWTFLMLGGKPDGHNVVELTAAQMAKIALGEPVQDLG